ncbi:MAG: hypothetical protein LBC86_05615 [Oscillospiraceae bacterium]|jgi:hypothetical protein|nr:hypothetical protein [Oscillospiraceae bacterium]
MMNSVLDTSFEMSLRILLLLAVSPNAMTVDMLALADTLSVYGANFGLTAENLHGESAYVLDEYDTRRELSKEAVKSLALRELLEVDKSEEGFRYRITANGKQFINSNVSEYANEYRLAAQSTINFIQNKTERELFRHMSKRFSVNGEEDNRNG